MADESGGERAPEDAWVLRGGTFDVDSTLVNHDRVLAAYGVHGVCVSSAPNMTVEQILAEAKFRSLKYGHATVAEIRNEGFEVIREFDHEWPSALLLFVGSPTTDDLGQLRSLFARRGIRDNPATPIRRNEG